MKLDFAKNTKRNMAANAVGNFIKLLFPFLNRTLFLWLLGPKYLGLNGLFGSILGVLMLAELGFGQAVVYSMYKPVADDDRELICAYLRFYRTVYRCVGAVIFGVGLCLLPFLGRLVHGDVPPDIDMRVLYLIHLVNTSASYFLFAYRGSVLGAHHRNDVITNIRTAVTVMQYVAVFLILLLTRNYYYYVVATVVFTVLQNILLVRASRKYFPDIEPRGALSAEKRRKVISDVKYIFMHKVGGVITHSTDNLVVSSFLGLVAVAAYGNYYYVLTSVGGIVAIFYNSIMGGFGNKIHTETREQNFKLLVKMNRLTLAATLWCAAMMSALYQPFMVLWTRKAEDPQALMRHWLTPALMVLYFYISQARQTLLMFKQAAGIWRQDRWKPIVAGAVNLGMNIAFVVWLPDSYKLDGVIFSTIFGFMFIQIPWETHVVFANFFDTAHEREYCRMHIGLGAFAVALCVATWGASAIVTMGGFAGLAARGLVAAAVSGALVALAFRRDVPELMAVVAKRRKR